MPPISPAPRIAVERNEPSYLPDVLHCIAQLRNEDPEHIAAATTANVRRLFRI